MIVVQNLWMHPNIHNAPGAKGATTGKGGHNYSGAKELWGRRMTTGGAEKSQQCQILLLQKDLRFEHGGAKLASCPGRHLTSLHPCQKHCQFRRMRTPFVGVVLSWLLLIKPWLCVGTKRCIVAWLKVKQHKMFIFAVRRFATGARFQRRNICPLPKLLSQSRFRRISAIRSDLSVLPKARQSTNLWGLVQHGHFSGLFF